MTPNDGSALIVEGSATASPAAAGPTSWVRSIYTTIILSVVFMLATADRNVMAILLVPIQQDLRVNDTAMGALVGAAFSFVYVTAALPLARMADRRNRRNMLGWAVGVWSLATAVCGTATSYFTLLLGRIGVALGEAAHYPVALSMVGDLHPRARRGIAVGCILIGSAVGVGLGSYFAGLISDLYGWRAAFLALGLPGIGVALLIFATVREPARGAYEPATPQERPPSTLEAIRYVFGVKSVRRLVVAKLLLGAASSGFLAWTPAFFMRVHGLSTTEMSASFGLVLAAASIPSGVIAGLLSDRLARSGERWRSFYCTIALLAGAPFSLLTFIAPTPGWAFAALFMMALITGGATSVSLTAGLGIVRNDMRGFMTAVMNFCITMFGAGVTPVLFGAITDLLSHAHGDEAIRYTLLLVPMLWALSGIAFWFVGRTTDHDAARALGDPATR